MENKINIAELLKDCPQGMELDCTMYEDVHFDYVDKLNIIHCYIQCENYKTSITFNQHGTPNSVIKSKCVIFPKGKTTWEGFVPPYQFKDGDILFVKSVYDWICIYKESKNDENLYKYVATQNPPYNTFIVYGDSPLCNKEDISEIRIASEEEKQKLFEAIKDNGYKWNEETKTLQKLIEPKFKVGDRVRHKNNHNVVFTITNIGDDYYARGGKMAFSFDDQDTYELVPNKFDITTLKPFESRVLVRDINTDNWIGAFYSHHKQRRFYTIGSSYYYQLIPYEGNEHLLDTTRDCDDFYKTWQL